MSNKQPRGNQITVSLEEWDKISTKAAKWDALDAKIAKFYPEYDDDGEEVETDDTGGDLCDIGEVAAMAFGYL